MPHYYKYEARLSHLPVEKALRIYGTGHANTEILYVRVGEKEEIFWKLAKATPITEAPSFFLELDLDFLVQNPEYIDWNRWDFFGVDGDDKRDNDINEFLRKIDYTHLPTHFFNTVKDNIEAIEVDSTKLEKFILKRVGRGIHIPNNNYEEMFIGSSEVYKSNVSTITKVELSLYYDHCPELCDYIIKCGWDSNNAGRTYRRFLEERVSFIFDKKIKKGLYREAFEYIQNLDYRDHVDTVMSSFVSHIPTYQRTNYIQFNNYLENLYSSDISEFPQMRFMLSTKVGGGEIGIRTLLQYCDENHIVCNTNLLDYVSNRMTPDKVVELYGYNSIHCSPRNTRLLDIVLSKITSDDYDKSKLDIPIEFFKTSTNVEYMYMIFTQKYKKYLSDAAVITNVFDQIYDGNITSIQGLYDLVGGKWHTKKGLILLRNIIEDSFYSFYMLLESDEFDSRELIRAAKNLPYAFEKKDLEENLVDSEIHQLFKEFYPNG